MLPYRQLHTYKPLGVALALMQYATDMLWASSWSPNGMLLALASHDKTVRVWDIATRKRLSTLSGQNGAVNTCLWSPDGKTRASASNDHTFRLWFLYGCLDAQKGGHAVCSDSHAGGCLAALLIRSQ